MRLFPIQKGKENLNHIKEKRDLRLDLSQIQRKNDEILAALREIKQKEINQQEVIKQETKQEEIVLKDCEWSREEREEALSQGRKALVQIENLMTSIIETNYKLEELDNSLVNRLSLVMPELNKQLLNQIKADNEGISEKHIKLHKKVNGNKVLLWVLFILQLVSLGALTFIILYLLNFI